MKIIEKLCDMISEEIDEAEEYAKSAIYYKEDYPMLGETLYKIANEKMGHMMLLHNQVTSIIDAYQKEKGEPPEAMKVLYGILHKKHIEHAAAVKGMLSLYKGGD